EIDAYVDYSGTLWTNVLQRTDNPGRKPVLDQLTAELKRRDGVLVLGSLGFENAYAFVMRPDRAAALHIASIADLAREAPHLTLGSDLEFLSRPEWKAVQSAYGLSFRTQRSYQPTFMYRALSGGEADVISAFSSDGRIAADKLVVLSDPKGAIPPYDAVVLISPGRAHDARLLGALKPMIGKIPVEAMREANLSVDRDQAKASPAEAARALRAKLGL
ncbi:MAG: substrate-binding region of ABC-type glycine betaine transport system, partial [Phenylobacterium sp.]|nr:substrate-binding region of ABC-type glycine betaine transport system [Phenylobacterium sp.]